MKLLFKTMMANRRRNIWLFAELVLVTIVTWIVIDPVVTLLGIAGSPHGYDYDRLVYMELGVNSTESPVDSIEERRSYDAIFERIKSMPGVESATVVNSWLRLESGSSMNLDLNYIDEKGDTVVYQAFRYTRPMGQDYFTTYGIKAADGSPSAEDLSDLSMNSRDIIVNESVAKLLFGDGVDYIGKETVDNGNGVSYKIVGVVKDVRPWHWRSLWRILWIDEQYEQNQRDYESTAFIVKMRDGEVPQRWVSQHKDEVLDDFKAGNLYISYVESYSEVSDGTWQSRMASNERMLKFVLLAFFLINLALGVAGTFYLQTRRRSHDAGIMKSFGANRGNVFRNLVNEAMLITFISWVTGCLIYLNYAWRNGLSIGIDWMKSDLPPHHWTSVFWQHFAVVSLVVLVVMLAIVFVGASLPASRISRVDPVDAIRDE